MNPRAAREKALFDAAVQMTDADERALFLRQECAGDPALQLAVAALLQSEEEVTPGFLDAPPGLRTLAGEGVPLWEGTVNASPTIGRYQLLEKLGEGGWGVVYVAEQTEPVRRRVAVKIVKLGMDTRAVIARFEAERQALALMDHPNIARVLDGGATDQGRPYFVMELVRGIHLTDYCEQANLDIPGRLELFIQVCQAIQHAHQKGVIHRDIKPSNILVTLHDGVPVPKVIDFGIAKATEGRLTDATAYTQLHQFIGTPAYMSPEQTELRSQDIDTRSDIYSLGVVLYELLTGTTPFDTKELLSRGLEEMRRTIREVQPVKPSTRWTQRRECSPGAAVSHPTPPSARAARARQLWAIPSDLDWIVMKCLEKDRARRYETANAVAADLLRHLAHEPIVARPPSRWYEFQKTVQRHKFGFAAAAAVFLALALGITASVSQTIRAKRAQGEAQQARQHAETAELAARQRAYGSDLTVASHAFAANNLGQALDLLNQQRPEAGQRDLRGWEWRYLWNQVRSDGRFPFPPDAAMPNRLAVSPDGKRIAVEVHHGGGLVVKDLETRRDSFRVATHEIGVSGAFSPTHPLLAYVGTSGPEGAWRASLRLRQLDTGSTTELPLEAALCMAMTFSRDGRALLTSSAQNKTNLQLTLWQMPEGRQLTSYPRESFDSPAWHSALAATSDLGLAAYSFGPGPQRIRMLDLRSGKALWTADAAQQYVSSMCFSPDGKVLASANMFTESDIRLWDVATGHELGRLAKHDGFVKTVLFSPDGRRIFSGGSDQTICVWDVASRTQVDALRGHRRQVHQLALLPDGHTLASTSEDGFLGLWDTSVSHSRQPVVSLPGKVAAYCFVPDSRSVLTLNTEGQVVRWSGSAFQASETLFSLGTTTSQDYKRECFSRDGRFLAAGSPHGVMTIWDVSRRSLIHRWTNGVGELIAGKFLAGGSRMIAWSFGDYRFHYCDVATGRDLWTWPLPKTWRGVMAVSPDEQACLAFDAGGEVRLKNLTDGSEQILPIHAPDSASAAYSPDGRRLVTQGPFMRIWNTATWQLEASVGKFLLNTPGLAFSPDGQRLAHGTGGNEVVRFQNPENWQEVFTLGAPGYAAAVDVSFSPDGNILGWLIHKSSALHLARAPSWEEIKATDVQE